jgi:hypothetical protein
VQAKGRIQQAKFDSKWEREYAQVLEAQRRAGRIHDWRLKPMRLRIGNGAFLTIDFLVVQNDGALELHEVKGHWREAAKVRVRVAQEMYPWLPIKIVRRERRQWKIEEL